MATLVNSSVNYQLGDHSLGQQVSFVPIPSHGLFQDLTGKVFGRWTVLGYVGQDKSNKTSWFCQCSCGKRLQVVGANLKNGISRSCGCLKDEVQRSRISHGEGRRTGKSSEYLAYLGAKNRCNNPTNKRYQLYGGRGIRFLYQSFEEFLADVGRKPSPKHSLDRKDTNGHYAVGNCRWATQQEQTRNQRRNRLMTVDGVTASVAEQAEKFNMPYMTVYGRLAYGFCDDCAVKLAHKGTCLHRK